MFVDKAELCPRRVQVAADRDTSQPVVPSREQLWTLGRPLLVALVAVSSTGCQHPVPQAAGVLGLVPEVLEQHLPSLSKA